jgi:hypothetical protein
VLQQRGLQRTQALMEEGLQNVRAIDAACAAARGGRRHCALASCAAAELSVGHFKLCSACRRVAYCCAAHQAAD